MASDTDKADYMFQVLLIGIVKLVQVLAVHIQDSGYFLTFKQRNNDLRAGMAAAGYMSGKLIYIGYDQGLRLCPAGAAYPSSFPDTGTGYGALEGAEYQLISLYQVKAHPKPSELFLQGGCNISHIRNQVRLLCDQCFDLG